MTEFLADTAACLARILAHAGAHLRVATPLGLGKPNVLLNAIYHRAESDASLKLDIYTALSLARPQAKSDLERRFLDPFLERHFGKDYPDLAWVAAQHANALPANIRVHEFYLQSGAMLGVAQSQRDYASLNYTHAARDLAGIGINVVVQMIAVHGQGAARQYSFACNPDTTAELLERMVALGAPRPLMIGVIHPDLPFIGNEALVDESFFDVVLDDPASSHALFALPREPVDTAEYAIGLHASTLVRDGGTLQIGIGALSDALVCALLLRQQRNVDYRATLKALGNVDTELSTCCGGIEPFARGLYGASEMVMDGFMHLARAGILSRRVFDDLDIEKALSTGRAVDVSTRGDGRYLRGAFYLGTKVFYDWLRGLKGTDFDGLSMTRVSDINQLYGGRETLDALQRRDARFFNTCMMATLLGAAASDTLENGQVVSGVGGQYNFVAMAHALAGGRSILLLRSARTSGGKLHSNILWNYGQCTIPRHLRDIYVTEYGIADLRGKSDEDCIIAMLGIADARFVDGLAAQAKATGKLRGDFAIPNAWRRNTPVHLAAALTPHRNNFPRFPFGSDFDETELRLLPALQRLQVLSANKLRLAAFAAYAVLSGAARTEDAPLLARLGLAHPRGLAERLLRRMVVRALHGS
ncbi:MAG TPA: acetyl-CoA hydrolase/transferase C-terminal domain-containing protein [Rudaea sp.]|nr:acetyl-CoA hydrolase/transferase C-terminal domain-containing protein [Rudaea sp.]